MDRVQLEVFRFESGTDYLPYYAKLTFCYQANHNIVDMLTFLQNEIYDYGCDTRHLALRINGIVIFENLSMIELTQRFGQEWCIEPISVYYAHKDLLINQEILWQKYEPFFAWADFINADERMEFRKYLMLNLVTPMVNEQYLGEGFFLYARWLIARHPEKMKEILQWLMHPQQGILNFTSLADMVYPRANELDEEIWSIIRDVIFPSNSKQWQYLQTLTLERKGQK